MKVLSITSTIHKLSSAIKKISEEEMAMDPTTDPAADTGLTEPAPEPAMSEPEKDQDTQLQEHVKANQDKYRMAFEALFPKAQMVAKNVEFHGAVSKDKIRVSVDFETPMLDFSSMKIMANKEIGIEATGENTFRVYNIFLPRVKDPTLK